ncbi:MAG: monooxygenase [Saprospiraceae bacterium]|jgi:monooxygenase
MKENHFDVLIIGAGISGISAAYYLQTDSPNKNYKILEGRGRLGGTWDLFKYPGIRSDSDMYTLGFAFKPWIDPKAIADGPSILRYLDETVAEFGIDQHIEYNCSVTSASWDSRTSLWTLEVIDGVKDIIMQYTCNFISMCAGYYNYDKGYTPDFPNMDKYQGVLIHPQIWPQDIDYTDKNVVVIGSGATAVTLIPELAKKATHVTMLQRSPTYIASGPDEDKIANWMNRWLPSKLAYSISRWRKILFQRFSYAIARKYPKTMKRLLIKGVKKELGEGYDIEKNFTPNYNPWDQRICLVPNGDLFEAIKDGSATVVTDHIESFTDKGITLKSGDELECDIIVSATGLELKFMGGIDFYIDGVLVDFSETVSYKSLMFSNVPNLSLAFGYTNASWTLKCDLSNQYVCRLLNHMDAHGFTEACPRQNDPTLEMAPWLDFTSGYIVRYIDNLPKVGNKGPWQLQHNYLHDRKMIIKGKVDDGYMEFS